MTSSTALILKVAEACPAAIVTVWGTVASVVSLEVRLTTKGVSVTTSRVTVPVAALFPAFSEMILGLKVTVNLGKTSSSRIVTVALP